MPSRPACQPQAGKPGHNRYFTALFRLRLAITFSAAVELFNVLAKRNRRKAAS